MAEGRNVKRIIGILAIGMVVGVGCEKAKDTLSSLTGQNRVTVTNQLTIGTQQVSGVRISIDGEVVATLAFGSSTTKNISKGTHRITAASDAFTGDASFTLVVNVDGGHGRLNLVAEETILGGFNVRFLCENCESIFG